MEERRTAEVERRAGERRANNQDSRTDTEKGFTGERRTGNDRRDGAERRSA